MWCWHRSGGCSPWGFEPESDWLAEEWFCLLCHGWVEQGRWSRRQAPAVWVGAQWAAEPVLFENRFLSETALGSCWQREIISNKSITSILVTHYVLFAKWNSISQLLENSFVSNKSIICISVTHFTLCSKWNSIISQLLENSCVSNTSIICISVIHFHLTF